MTNREKYIRREVDRYRGENIDDSRLGIYLVPSLPFSDVMAYLLPDVEVKGIMFDTADPSVASVSVVEKDSGDMHRLELRVTLVDGEGLPVFGNHELIG